MREDIVPRVKTVCKFATYKQKPVTKSGIRRNNAEDTRHQREAEWWPQLFFLAIWGVLHNAHSASVGLLYASSISTWNFQTRSFLPCKLTFLWMRKVIVRTFSLHCYQIHLPEPSTQFCALKLCEISPLSLHCDGPLWMFEETGHCPSQFIFST